MTRRPTPPDGLSREESLYLDGEATPTDARRLERQLAADPERAERIDAYREAMDTWREDAARSARAAASPDALADRVLAAVAQEEHKPESAPIPPAARWYAAAAVFLIALGLTGTFMATPHTKRTAVAVRPPQPADAELEQAVLDIFLDSPELSPPLATSKEGR